MRMNKMHFCIECGREVNYNIVSERVETVVRGIKFSYVELSAYCKVCEEEIYIPEINDVNHEAREEAYRKAARLISVSEIQDVLEKYNIGAGPLAKLLGFGEVTINRYLLGQLPSRSHSERLLSLKNNHKLMETILEEGKDRISLVAYKKCKEKLEYLNNLYINNKIDLVSRYFLIKAVDITSLALQKLLYYAQAFFYAIYNEELFADDCQAWALGPVFPEIYYKYKANSFDPIDNPFEEYEKDFDELTIKEREFLNVILSCFGCYSGKTLSEMTHRERPWIEARGSLQPADRSMTVIDRKVINEYFAQIVKRHEIVNPCDILRYSKDMYEKLSVNIC